MHDKFNCFFSAGSKQYLEFLLTSNVKKILISYAYPAAWELMPLIMQNHVEIMCDSGAFTSWSQAQRKKNLGDPNWEDSLVDINMYAQHLDKYKDVIKYAVNLDVIPGEQGKEPTEAQKEEAAEQGWKNYLYLKEKGHDTVHVYHQGESFKHLDRMLDNCHYIGVSPNNDFSDDRKLSWLDHVYRYISKSKNPTIKTHGFGVTSKRLMERYPWYSCDSASYSLTAAMGSVLTPFGRIYVSDKNLYDKDHILNKPLEVVQHINKYFLERIGYGVKSMTETKSTMMIKCKECGNEVHGMVKSAAYKPRNFANIAYFLDLEKKIQENGSNLNFRQQEQLL